MIAAYVPGVSEGPVHHCYKTGHDGIMGAVSSLVAELRVMSFRAEILHLLPLPVCYPGLCGRCRSLILVLLVTGLVYLESRRLQIHSLLQLLLRLLSPLHPQLCLKGQDSTQ